MTISNKSAGKLLLVLCCLWLCVSTGCARPQPVYVQDSSKPAAVKKGQPSPADGYWISGGAMADLIFMADHCRQQKEK